MDCSLKQDTINADGNHRGQVSIFMNGKSFYVCYNYAENSFNRGAAAAVCRQKGFVDAEDVGTPHMIEYAPYKLLDLTKLNYILFLTKGFA